MFVKRGALEVKINIGCQLLVLPHPRRGWSLTSYLTLLIDTLRSNRVIGLSGKQSMKSRAGRGNADGERA